MLQPLLRPAAVAANDRLRGASPVVLPAPPLFDLDFVGRPSLQYPGLPPLVFARSTVATYRDSSGVRRSAAIDEPRFDHDINGTPLGLLMELPRTNYLLNSTVPATQTTGSLAAGDYLLWTEGPGSAAVAGASATITGAGTATEGSCVPFTVTVAGTVTVTKTGTLTAFQLEARLPSVDAGNLLPTSLVATAGATVTRGSEQLSLTSAPPWFDAAEGTLYAEFDSTVPSRIFDIIDNSSDNSDLIAIRSNANSAGGTFNNLVRRATVAEYQDLTLPMTRGAVARSAMAYKANDCRSAFGGTLGPQDTTVTLPTVDMVRIGWALTTSLGQPNGHIRRLTYWPRRLPDGVLQALTR